MKIAHITPPAWVKTYTQGTYRMALAHWALENSQYIKHIKSDNAYVILDSGTFEDKQVSTAQLNRIAMLMGADEVVLPDVKGNAKETLGRSWMALPLINCQRVMFVPHGQTNAEWLACLEAWVTKWNGSNWRGMKQLCIGIPATYKQVNSRPKRIIAASEYGFPIHLLGLHKRFWFAEELPIAIKHGVRGMDTSTAFALGAKGRLVTYRGPKVHLGDPDQYDKLSIPYRRLPQLNMRILNWWVGTGEVDPNIGTRLIRDTASRWMKYYAQGFAKLTTVMTGCGMPKGKYALRMRPNGTEWYLRHLESQEDPTKLESEVVLSGL